MIELSLVLFIVGFLIFGVLAGQYMVRSFTLAKARSLTSSSSVGGIEDLTFWFETTSEDSFLASEVVDGGTISQWNDINPRLQFKKNLTDSTSGTSTDRPIYTERALGNLPALYFDGAADTLTRTNVYGNDLTPGSEITVFIVQKAITPLQSSHSVTWIGASSSKVNLHIPWSDSNIYWDFGICCGAGSRVSTAMPTNFVNNWNIISTIRRTDGTGDITVNNTSIVTTSSFNNVISGSDSGTFAVGSNGSGATFFKGYMAEIIIYSRALSTDERSQVMSYLSRKWGISIS